MADKVKAVILTVLNEMGASVQRTLLVKLVYLADNTHFEHFGSTITGLDYMWDSYGPNAISNAIVIEADEVVQEDLACMKVGTSIYGSDNYLYTVGLKESDLPDRLLSPIEKQVILDTIKRYRGRTLQQVVGASKRTKPFIQANQYEVLEMRQSSDYLNMVKTLESNPDFMAAIKEGTKADAEVGSLRLEEVRQKYGL